jgi:hypothetical protein
MKGLRESIADLTTEKERYIDSVEVLRILEGIILRKQNRLLVLHIDYNMID